MKNAIALVAGLFCSLSLASATDAGDHVYFHHTQPAYVYHAGPAFYPAGFYASSPVVAYYAPHAYVAPSAYAPVIAHPGPVVVAPPSAVWSCCPPQYRHAWHGYAHSLPAHVRVDYKYGLFGHVKGFTIRY